MPAMLPTRHALNAVMFGGLSLAMLAGHAGCGRDRAGVKPADPLPPLATTRAAATPPRSYSPDELKALAARVELGMTCQQVEAVMGGPGRSGEVADWRWDDN